MRSLNMLSIRCFPPARQVILWLLLALVAAPGVALGAPTSLDGRVRVANERMTRVTVHIDDERRGTVYPGQTVVFKSVPNGTRLVSFTGPRVEATSAQVVVPVRGLGSYVLAPVRGALRLRNDSGVTMAVRLDGRRLGRVSAGDVLAADGLEPGRYRLFTRPVGREYGKRAGFERTVFVRAGQMTESVLGPWFAALEVKNPYNAPVRVFLDGTEMPPLLGGATLLFPRQAPGRHTLVLRRAGRILATDTVEFIAGQRLRWSPKVALGQVRVTNTTGRRLTMRLGNDRLAVLAPGEMRTFHGLTPGAHRVTVQGTQGRRRMQTIQVAANGTSNVALGGPRQAPGVLF